MVKLPAQEGEAVVIEVGEAAEEVAEAAEVVAVVLELGTTATATSTTTTSAATATIITTVATTTTTTTTTEAKATTTTRATHHHCHHYRINNHRDDKLLTTMGVRTANYSTLMPVRGPARDLVLGSSGAAQAQAQVQAQVQATLQHHRLEPTVSRPRFGIPVGQIAAVAAALASQDEVPPRKVEMKTGTWGWMFPQPKQSKGKRSEEDMSYSKSIMMIWLIIFKQIIMLSVCFLNTSILSLIAQFTQSTWLARLPSAANFPGQLDYSLGIRQVLSDIAYHLAVARVHQPRRIYTRHVGPMRQGISNI